MNKTNITRMMNSDKEILLFTNDGACIALPKGKALEQLVSFLNKNKEKKN